MQQGRGAPSRTPPRNPEAGLLFAQLYQSRCGYRDPSGTISGSTAIPQAAEPNRLRSGGSLNLMGITPKVPAQMSKDPIQRRLVAILATDVVGYSLLMERDETATLADL